MSKKQVNTSNRPTGETLAKALLAAPEEEDGAPAYTIIGAAKLQQRAAVMARLGITYYDDLGMPHSNGMLRYEPTDTDIQYNLTTAGVPDGSVVKFYLDVNASEDVINDQLFTFDRTATEQPLWTCNGTAGLVNFWLEGFVPAPPGPSKKRPHHPKY